VIHDRQATRSHWRHKRPETTNRWPDVVVCYGFPVVSSHTRFELLDVVLGELPIGRCTIDRWQDDGGNIQWSARVLMARDHATVSGRLVGRNRAGQVLAGEVKFATDQEGPRGARTVLVELHGTGPLLEVATPT
jgi:hypothetical protein